MRRAYAMYNETPMGFAYEALSNRDCAVRALRCAAGCSYENAHRLLKGQGRIDRRATYNPTVAKAAYEVGLLPVEIPGGGWMHPRSCSTLAQFVREHPTGRYVLRVNTHFLALVDGVVHDWDARKTGSRTRVTAAWGRS